MSIKGVVSISRARQDASNPGLIALDVWVSGLDPTNLYGPTQSSLSAIDPVATDAFIGSQVEQLAQSILVGQGYVFSSGDYVRLIGGI